MCVTYKYTVYTEGGVCNLYIYIERGRCWYVWDIGGYIWGNTNDLIMHVIYIAINNVAIMKVH